MQQGKVEIVRGAVAYVERSGLLSEILQIKRARPPYEGYYAPPGGRNKKNEAPWETVEREVREETGVRVKALQKLGSMDFPGDHDSSKIYLIDVFRCEYLSGEPKIGDGVDDARWLSRKDMTKTNIAPPFLKFYAEIVRREDPVYLLQTLAEEAGKIAVRVQNQNPV